MRYEMNMAIGAVELGGSVRPAAVRYIKLGPSGAFLRRCIDQGLLELGHASVPHDLAARDDWSAVERLLEAQGRTPGKVTDFTRELRDFYTLGPDTLWITFGEGRMWWTFAQPEVEAVEGEGRGARVRKVIGSWRDTDLAGNTLAINSLSTRLTKVAAYRQTLCKVGAEDYLIQRLNAEEPLALARARNARAELIGAAEQLISMLDWHDFELLTDLIFATSGWRRRSAVGGSGQADTDLILEQAVTGERAFVQVKSSASRAVLQDYVDRFTDSAVFDRMFFVCHAPVGGLPKPVDPRVQLWLGPKLAEQAVNAGLFDWLMEKVR
jgi:hypothetical protein